MKVFAFITGAVSISLTSLGILFKLMHWPGTGILLLVGIVLFSIFFVPSIAVYLYKREK